MPRKFPQVLKGAATATGKNPARIGTGGPKAKQITLPSLESLKVLLEDKVNTEAEFAKQYDNQWKEEKEE